MFFQSEKVLSAIPTDSGKQMQAGQILIIVVVAVVSATVMGLSLASRIITSLKSSTQEAEFQKAQSAAEAGIERSIQGTVPISVSGNNLSNHSSYFTKFEVIQSSDFLLSGGSTTKDPITDKIIKIEPNLVSKGEGIDIWFIKHKADNTLDYSDYSSSSPNFLNLYWGLPSEGCASGAIKPAAIQVIIVTGDQPSPPDILPANVKSYRYAYDPCSIQRENNFTLADSGSFPQDYDGGGKIDITFSNSTPKNHLAKDIAGAKNIILMRVIPIYKDTSIALNTCNPSDKGKGCTSLPTQGYVITSTGKSGDVSQKISAFKGYPQMYLPYLSYGLFVVNN